MVVNEQLFHGVDCETVFDDAERRSLGLFTDLGVGICALGMWWRSRERRQQR